MSKQQEWREWIKVAGVVAIPVVVVIMGAVFAKSNATREVNAKMVEIAAQVLTDPPTDSTQAVRQWAVDVMKHYSEVPFSASAESTFKGFTLPPRSRLPNPEWVPVMLSISPAVAAALPGQEVNFTVVGRIRAGDTVPVSATWSATNGTITDTSASHGRYARFRADTVVGNVRVVARSQGLETTALVRVRP